MVQLGAFKQHADAVSARTALAGTLSDVLRQRPLALVTSKSDGRTRVLFAQAFRTRRAAAAVCAAIKARGPACVVVRA